MKNFIQDGSSLEYVNTTGSAISSGDVVVVGHRIGIAATNIPTDESGTVATCGVFEVPKVSTAVIAQGEMVIWDASSKAFEDSDHTPDTGDVSGCCTAWAAAGNGATTMHVQLGGIGTVA